MITPAAFRKDRWGWVVDVGSEDDYALRDLLQIEAQWRGGDVLAVLDEALRTGTTVEYFGEIVWLEAGPHGAKLSYEGDDAEFTFPLREVRDLVDAWLTRIGGQPGSG